MNPPQVIIVVEGGVVTHIATDLPELKYKIIDLDSIRTGERDCRAFEEADATGIDIDEHIKVILEETQR